MSAIFGIHYSDERPVSSSELDRMAQALAHRGPDGSRVWCDGPVGLGHRMLMTTAESLREHLPFHDLSGHLVITADARLDNRDELISLLRFSAPVSAESTDSELILAAYRRWREACAEKLLGDFAFAIWDARSKNLFCARDHFGVRPFYYHSSSKLFAFATEIKALLCLDEVPRRLDEMKVADHFAGAFEDKEITFYRDIQRLPPGHSLSIGRDRRTLRQYWSANASQEVRLGSDDEYAEAFRDLFSQAVSCRLRSTFPVGSMLSGGLDSSAITCMARDLRQRNGGEPLPTFSAVFDTVNECDERQFINAILEKDGLEPFFFVADRHSPLSDLERVLWHQDEVLMAFNLYLNWGLYKLAKVRGIRVLLDGFDGDTTVSHGTVYLDELARAGRWLTLARELDGYARNVDGSARKLIWSYLREYKLKPALSGSSTGRFVRRAGRAIRSRLTRDLPGSANHWHIQAALNPNFVRRIGFSERQQSLRKLYGGTAKTEREDHLQRLNWGVMPYTLEVLDKAAAAFGIELRFPFWDKRLVEFCLSVPAEQKMARGWTRLIMRRAMDGILPPEVQWRARKTNLGPGFNYGLTHYEQERLAEFVRDDTDKIEPYVDISALRQAHRRFASNKATQDNDVNFIWKAATLGLWLQHSGLRP